MRLQLSPEEDAFREEMRTFFTTQVPESIREAVAANRDLGREQYVETQQILNAAGLAVPHWPIGVGRPGLDAAAAPHLARADAAGVASPSRCRSTPA